MLAPEVETIEFAYFDGRTVYQEWDSFQQNKLPTAVKIAISLRRPAWKSQRSSARGTDQEGTSMVYETLVYLPNALATLNQATAAVSQQSAPATPAANSSGSGVNAIAPTGSAQGAKSMKSRRPAGMVLVFVLVMIVILGLSVFGVAERMLLERQVAERLGRRAQARELAESGAEMARQFLDRQPGEQDGAGGSYDNPQLFRGVLAADDDLPRNRGRFTIVALRVQDRAAATIRFGLEDESTRINLRTILKMDQTTDGNAKKMLMALPGMTDSIADAILDWIDADSIPPPGRRGRLLFGDHARLCASKWSAGHDRGTAVGSRRDAATVVWP